MSAISDLIQDKELCEARDALLELPNANAQLESNGIHLKINGYSIAIWVLDEWRSYLIMLRELIEGHANDEGLDKRAAFPWIAPELWEESQTRLKGFKDFALWRAQARYCPRIPGFWRIALNQTRSFADFFESEEDLQGALDRFNEAMGVQNNNEAVGDISFAPIYSGRDYRELFDNLMMDGVVKEPINNFIGLSYKDFEWKVRLLCQ